MSEKYLIPQLKKLNKILERAQKENADLKEQLEDQLRKTPKGTYEYNDLIRKIKKVPTISHGTKKTYYDTTAAVLKDAYEKFGITHWKQLKPEHTEQLLVERIKSGQSPSTIRKVAHSLEYVNQHAQKTRVFNENFNITDHTKMLKIMKENKVIRKAENSHRYKANSDECQAVLKEMEKRNPYLASIARYQFLTGFRVSEAISQKEKNLDIENGKHIAEKAKGGLTNIVHTNHHNQEEKEFLENLKKNYDKETGRIFHRQKDSKGNYKSDVKIQSALTRLAGRCAKKLGIGGSKGQTFSSHSFRGGFALIRMTHYCKNHDKLDDLIKEKISEDPKRLNERFNMFKKRIYEKRGTTEIKDFEKVQWLVSTDLNHSRQDIVRYYVSYKTIQSELSKYKG